MKSLIVTLLVFTSTSVLACKDYTVDNTGKVIECPKNKSKPNPRPYVPRKKVPVKVKSEDTEEYLELDPVLDSDELYDAYIYGGIND